MPSLTTKGRSLKKTRVPVQPPGRPSIPPPEERNISLTDWLLDTVVAFPKFASRLLKVQTTAGDLVPFEINDIQALLEQIIDDIRSKGRLVRLVILKARREGVSTWVSGRFFWKATTNKNRHAMIICHEPDATDFVFQMHKRFQLNVPEQIRADERYNNKKMLHFNNERGTGLDSSIRVGTAGKEDFGSGQLIHYLHLSELAKYPRHTTTQLLTAILQCVPDHPDTEVVFESTAKGVGGEFYSRFWACRYRYEMYLEKGVAKFKEVVNTEASEDNEYTGIFMPWYVFSAYRRSVYSQLTYTPDEQKLVDLYGVTSEQIAWRRHTIENKCHGDANMFKQEYPSNAMEAFISSSDNIFPVEEVQRRIALCKPPLKKYDVQLTTGNWLAKDDGKLWVWDEPVPGREYMITGDPAEGLEKGDWSSGDVIDCLTGKQVAHWHGKIPPDQFAYLLAWTGKRYNTAIAVVERNNHGALVVDKLISLGYSRVYSEMVPNMVGLRPRKRYGWVTSVKSKPMIIDNLSGEFREMLDGISCAETLKEMMTFKQFEDGTIGAEVGFHDDRVMSYAIGKFVRTKLPKYNRMIKINNNPAAYYQGQRQMTNPQSSIGPESWT